MLLEVTALKHVTKHTGWELRVSGTELSDVVTLAKDKSIRPLGVQYV